MSSSQHSNYSRVASNVAHLVLTTATTLVNEEGSHRIVAREKKLFLRLSFFSLLNHTQFDCADEYTAGYVAGEREESRMIFLLFCILGKFMPIVRTISHVLFIDYILSRFARDE